MLDWYPALYLITKPLKRRVSSHSSLACGMMGPQAWRVPLVRFYSIAALLMLVAQTPALAQLSPAELVKRAEDSRNLSTCLQGYAALCAHDRLTGSEVSLVANAERERNLRTCLQGYPALCNHSQLTQVDVARVRAAEHSKNLSTCLQGYPALCNHSDLNSEEAARAAKSEYDKNYQTCMQGYAALCDHALLARKPGGDGVATPSLATSSPRTSGAVSGSIAAATPPASAPVTTLPSVTLGARAGTSGCAENGSCYGDISPQTGLPKTVTVQGYIRRDGTYVRGYYRSHR